VKSEVASELKSKSNLARIHAFLPSSVNGVRLKAYNTPYRLDMEKSLRDCAKDCVNKDECVVLTGHSQGGAIAAVAAVYLADLNPYVFTFGQPPTVYSPCPLITSDRWYRYVNTKNVQSGLVGIAYDPVPFAPSLGADHFGHMLLLSEDPIDVAYIGLDVQDSFSPLNVNGFESHSMVHANGSAYPGYLDRIDAIVLSYGNVSYPVNPSGYTSGSLCVSNRNSIRNFYKALLNLTFLVEQTKDLECSTGHCGKETLFSYYQCIGTSCKRDTECETGRCDSGVCSPKLASCMMCDEDSDCLYGHCSAQFRCSGENKLMDNDCLCFFNSDCHSGRCEGVRPSVCEAKLGEGAYCSESSDCESNQCSWSFRCSGSRATPSAIADISDSATLISIDPIRAHVASSFLYSSRICLLVFLVAFVGALLYRFSTSRNQRQGYDSIPTTSSV
jgi:Lipase (class 3)